MCVVRSELDRWMVMRCVVQEAMAAAAEAATASKPAASNLSSEIQAKIAANKAKAMERRRAKAAAAAAAEAGLPSPEEEAEMMAAAASKPAQQAASSSTSSSSSSFPADDELDALMAEQEGLGDLYVHCLPCRSFPRGCPRLSQWLNSRCLMLL
jgi:acyl-CoA reductase-like NAD-dependent aldehyde dehydrogenase